MMKNKQEKFQGFSSMLLKYFLICEVAAFLVVLAAALIEDGPLLAALRNQMQWGILAHIGVLIGVLVGCYWRYRRDTREDSEDL